MSVALIDLDNTLLDRVAAFSRWAATFVEEQQLPPDAVSVLIEADHDGSTPRDDFFAEVCEVLPITTPLDELLTRYHQDYPSQFRVPDQTVEALRKLRAHQWKVGVVTNGPPSQQRKLDVTRLTHEVDAVCISSVVGCWKPDPEIFYEAARLCGSPLDGWMVGDSAAADIAGGRGVGLRTVWIPRGRRWDSTDPPPDAIASTVPGAVDVILRG